MPNPNSIANGQARLLDPVVKADGTVMLKLSLGTVAVAGADDDAAWQGTATHLDDAVFGVASDGIAVAGGLADETATDSVSEGDVGALRMTLDRRLITAGQIVDDAAFGVATSYVTTIGGLADEMGTDSVDEGDTGAVRMTLDRRLHVVTGQYNGSTYEVRRGNQDLTVFASAARTATPTPFDGTNLNGRGLHLVIDCTAVTATPSVVFTIQGADVLSGKFYTILVSAAITGTGTTVLRVYPGLTASANVTASDILPRTWRVIATHGDADSITYSVGASLIV